jgi:hypothetical protein
VRPSSQNIAVTSCRKRSTSLKPVSLETRWRAAAPELKAFVTQFTASLLAREDGQGLRRRARKAADQEKFARAVEAICCNFAAAAMFDSRRALAVQLGNYASSHSPIYGKHFNRAIALMEEGGLLTLTRGHRFSRFGRASSTIRPTPQYWRLAPRADSWTALHLEEWRDVVTINTAKGDSRKITSADKEWLRSAATEVRRINEHLRSVALRYAGHETIQSVELPGRPTVALVTPHHRSIRRMFKGSVEQGGRLYGGFWETMPRAARFKHLTINGEPVVNVDYSQLFLRLAYGLAKQAPPPGDLYDLTGHDHHSSNWEQLRTGRKRLVNALIFADRQLKQWPGQTSAERVEVINGFRPRSLGEAVAAIKARHRAIAREWFERGRGLELMKLESDILVAVLLRLINIGKNAVPLHDSVIVARSDGEAARRVMIEEALRLTRAEIPVKVDAG